MEDKENYIRMLEHKRDTELPEIIKELELKLEMWEKEKVDIDLEIQHLRAKENRKTVFDLPVLLWEKVKRNLIQPQNEIHALSLSSAKFDAVFQESSRFIKMEKAFTILLTNFYLDCTDLLNCMETTCENLGKIASRTWHFLENPNYQIVNAVGVYRDFRAEIECKRAENKIWTCFAGKIIRFNSGGRFSERYWNESKEFLQEYGDFSVNIELRMEIYYLKDLEAKERTDYIHNMLLDGKLPNLQFLHVYIDDGYLEERPVYGLRAQVETRSLQNYFCLRTNTVSNYAESKKAFVKLPGLIAEAWDDDHSRCVVSFNQLRSMIYHWERHHLDEKLKKRVIPALKNCLSHTKELAVSACNNLRDNLQFAENFTALSKFSIHVRNDFRSRRREDFIIPSNIRLPTVKTLTYGLDSGPIVPRLRDIMPAFPSLRCVNIKTGCPRDEFIVLVKKIIQQAETEANNVNGNDDAFEDLDIFQRIINQQPLTESDIWIKVPKLNVFCLIIGKLVLDYKIKSNVVEKYTRNFRDRESIRVEMYLETVATQFPKPVRV